MRTETKGGPTEISAPLRSVDQKRIMDKVNACMSRRDYAGVERTLLYWLEEARLGRDRRGELMIQNELVGHYRKTGEKEKAHESAREALALIRDLDYGDSLSAATAYVNIATAYYAFGEYRDSLELFTKARAIYESSPAADDALLGGLYNNMGLTCAALEKYADAMALYGLALERMERAPGGAPEMAMTCLNMADAVAARDGMEQAEAAVFSLLDRAESLLEDGGTPRDGYYAYVCEHCAPTFSYYGYFLTAETLKKRAEEIYERA